MNFTYKYALILFVVNLVVVMIIQAVKHKPLFGFIFEDENETLLAAQSIELRLDWSYLPPVTEMGKRIQASQDKCAAADSTDTKFYIHQMIRGGLGEGIHGWSQSLCNAVENDAILLTRGEWDWTLPASNIPFDFDVGYSPLWAYFGHHESSEDCQKLPATFEDPRINYISDAWVAPDQLCPSIIDLGKGYSTISHFRAGSMEWLFSSVNSNVIIEAQKIIHRTFGGKMPNADDLITLHLYEGNIAKRFTVEDYLREVRILMYMSDKDGRKDPINIYLISENDEQAEEFKNQAPENWKIYQSQPIYETYRADRASGKAGLQTLASILVALEANNFLLTTKSNLSRLINELRSNIVDARCDKCTTYNDIEFGEWR